MNNHRPSHSNNFNFTSTAAEPALNGTNMNTSLLLDQLSSLAAAASVNVNPMNYHANRNQHHSNVTNNNSSSSSSNSYMNSAATIVDNTNSVDVGNMKYHPPQQHHHMTILVPCRARGMPVEHNPKTAHFRISEDMKHGTELVCSFPSCRRAGIKFCYCAFCQTPVAKRNFRKRHMHDDLDANGQIVSSEMSMSSKQNYPHEDDEEEDVGDAVSMSMSTHHLHHLNNQNLNSADSDSNTKMSRNVDASSSGGVNGGMRNVTLPLKRFAPTTFRNSSNLGSSATTTGSSNGSEEGSSNSGEKRDSPEFDNGNNSGSNGVAASSTTSSTKKRRLAAASASSNGGNTDNSNDEEIGSSSDNSALSQSKINSSESSKLNMNMRIGENKAQSNANGVNVNTAQKLSSASSKIDVTALIASALSENTSNYSEQTLRQWIRVLFHRPRTEDQAGMSQWLLQVISIAAEVESNIDDNEENNHREEIMGRKLDNSVENIDAPKQEQLNKTNDERMDVESSNSKTVMAVTSSTNASSGCNRSNNDTCIVGTPV